MSTVPPRPAVRDRYAQCTDDCTTDCGACKGSGRPAAPEVSVCSPACGLDQDGGHWHHLDAERSVWASYPRYLGRPPAPDCTCGHDGLPANFHMTPCPIKVAHLAAVSETVRAPACPVDRVVYGDRPCTGPGSYYCDSELWGSACRAYYEQKHQQDSAVAHDAATQPAADLERAPDGASLVASDATASAAVELVVSCLNESCPRPALLTSMTFDEIAPGIAGVPRLLCAGCGCELYLHRDTSRF